MYQQMLSTYDGQLLGVIKLSTGTLIPIDPANLDFQEYCKWLEAGNFPLPPNEEIK